MGGRGSVMPGLSAGLVRAYHFVVPPFSAADPRAPMSRVSTHVGQSSLLPGFEQGLENGLHLRVSGVAGVLE